MSTLERYDAAVDGFAVRLAGLGPSDFARPSPCEGWSAGVLVDHTISTLLFAASLPGPVADDVAASRSARFAAAASALRGRLLDPEAAAAMHDTPFGTLALKQVVSSVVVHDVLVHTWDLARATGGDEALDKGLCRQVLEAMTPFDAALRGHGFGAKVDPPAGADEQTRLLCFLGRRP